MANKKLVLIGGGHAHMMVIDRLSRFTGEGVQVTVIQPSPYHYYSGMGPGMLGGRYTTRDIRFETARMVERAGGTFLCDYALRIDPEARQVHLKNASTPVSYDLLSCNTGSQVDDGTIRADNRSVFSVKPIEQLDTARRRILSLGKDKRLRTVVIGGGPSAVEIAGNLWRLATVFDIQPLQITVIAGRGIMPHAPLKVREKAVASLRKRGIELHTDRRVTMVKGNRLLLDNGGELAGDIIFSAVGILPSPLFTASHLATGPSGGLKVNSFLQHVDYPDIFGGGDCIYFADRPLDKVGVYAVRQNPVLLHNLTASLRGDPLIPFHPGGDYLLIYNLGDGTAIFHKGPLVFSGRLAFLVKNAVDRRFIRTFQH